MNQSFSHIDNTGNPAMVDVTAKTPTDRMARAQALVALDDQILDQLREMELRTKKGPVFQTAVVAGIMAAKRTGELIPLCHPLGLSHCAIDIRVRQDGDIEIICTARIHASTGVEMEALTGASIAALTIYDMCKAMSHTIVIREIRLLEKRGGKSDFRHSP